MTETSIGQLFAAGIVPGFLICIALLAVVHVVTQVKGYDRPRPVPPPGWHKAVFTRPTTAG